MAGDDGAERGRIGSLHGTLLTDTAHYGHAIRELTTALELSRDAGDLTQVAFTLAMLGRAHLLCDELDAARALLDESVAVSQSENWTASPRGPRPPGRRRPREPVQVLQDVRLRLFHPRTDE